MLPIAHCGLLGNERADEEARKAADLGPEDGAQKGRISFEVVKRLITCYFDILNPPIKGSQCP
jgi:hypothetical protein